MKRIIIWTVSIIGFFILVLLFAPLLFKGKIKTLAQQAANDNLNAYAHFGDLELSLLRNFPNATVSLRNFYIAGKDEFEGDTLISGDRFDIVVELWGAIMGKGIVVKKIRLDRPDIKVIVTKEGKANYDIAKAVAEETPDTAAPAAFQLTLKKYAINSGNIRYVDATYPMDVNIVDLDHVGSGDFSEVIYDLRTKTQAKSLSVTYDGVKYMENLALSADVRVNVNTQKDMLITLEDNEVFLNELGVHADGKIVYRETDMDLDLRFGALEKESFKDLLSLVPGAYSESFKNVEAEGTLDFHGTVNGTYSETSLPGFDITLKAQSPRIKYPDMPLAATDIDLDLNLKNTDGVVENTIIDINKFAAKLGSNPIYAEALIQGLETIFVDGKVDARLNLGELAQVFPIEGNTLKGNFALQAEFKGTYDSTKNLFPKVVADMSLINGYVKNSAYPDAVLDNMQITAKMTAPDGDMKAAQLYVPDFKFRLNEDPFEGNLSVKDFDDPQYKLQAKGVLDLEKLMKIYPIDSMKMRGKIYVDNLITSGRLSDIEKEQYTQLPTSGTVRVENVYYQSPSVPYGAQLAQGAATFTPSKIEIASLNGKIGASDFAVEGYVDNYLAYALLPNQPLRGAMFLKSRNMNLNEFMSDAATTAPTGTTPAPDTAGLSPIPVPENIDFIFQADIDKITYRNWNLTDFNGAINVGNQQVLLDQAGFNLFGGRINMGGSYNTQNIRLPQYNFSLDISKLGFGDAVKNLLLVRSYIPVAKYIDGAFNTQFKIAGKLNNQMMPILENISSSGLFEILEGNLLNFSTLAKVVEKTQLNDLASLRLKGVKGQFYIQDGAINIDTLSITHKDMKIKLSGKQFLNGKIDYILDLDIPSGKLGQSAYAALGKLTGGAVSPQERLQLSLQLSGDAKNPDIKGLKSASGKIVRDQLTEAAEDKLSDKLGKNVELDKDSVKVQMNDALAKAKDSLRAGLEAKKQAAIDSLRKASEARKQAIKDSVEKALKDKIGKDNMDKLNDLKNKLGLPKKKNN